MVLGHSQAAPLPGPGSQPHQPLQPAMHPPEPAAGATQLLTCTHTKQGAGQDSQEASHVGRRQGGGDPQQQGRSPCAWLHKLNVGSFYSHSHAHYLSSPAQQDGPDAPDVQHSHAHHASDASGQPHASSQTQASGPRRRPHDAPLSNHGAAVPALHEQPPPSNQHRLSHWLHPELDQSSSSDSDADAPQGSPSCMTAAPQPGTSAALQDGSSPTSSHRRSHRRATSLQSTSSSSSSLSSLIGHMWATGRCALPAKSPAPAAAAVCGSQDQPPGAAQHEDLQPVAQPADPPQLHIQVERPVAVPPTHAQVGAADMNVNQQAAVDAGAARVWAPMWDSDEQAAAQGRASGSEDACEQESGLTHLPLVEVGVDQDLAVQGWQLAAAQRKGQHGLRGPWLEQDSQHAPGEDLGLPGQLGRCAPSIRPQTPHDPFPGVPLDMAGATEQVVAVGEQLGKVDEQRGVGPVGGDGVEDVRWEVWEQEVGLVGESGTSEDGRALVADLEVLGATACCVGEFSASYHHHEGPRSGTCEDLATGSHSHSSMSMSQRFSEGASGCGDEGGCGDGSACLHAAPRMRRSHSFTQPSGTGTWRCFWGSSPDLSQQEPHLLTSLVSPEPGAW